MSPRVSLFVPCFVEHLSTASLHNLTLVLDRLGIRWHIPTGQTCCGQPSYNAGLFWQAAACAEHLLEIFADAEVVVAPSASCVAMLQHYPQLKELSPKALSAAESLAKRSYEICSYLVDVLGIVDVGASYHGRVAYHDSCHALRQLLLRDQPRALLRAVRGLELVELDTGPECCGFGGTFSVKYPEISADMADAKLAALARTGSQTLVTSDPSCLLHLEARARRRQIPFVGWHVVDVLAQQQDRTVARSA